jgi:chromosome partitioning protein
MARKLATPNQSSSDSVLNPALTSGAGSLKPLVSCGDLSEMAFNAENVLAQIRSIMLKPYPRKAAPEFSAFQVATNIGLDRTALKAAEARIKSTRGSIKADATHKTYTLQEAIELYQLLSDYKPRPEGKPGKMVAVASYKGGVGKTTTAVNLAQGLTLQGRKVLLIDLDGQGSATMLLGLAPSVEVMPEQTVMPYIFNDKPDLSYAPIPTYWHNLDLIPASSALLSADMVIPKYSAQKNRVENGLIRNGWATPQQIREAKAVFGRRYAEDQTVTLDQILIETGVATAEQIYAVSYRFWNQIEEGIDELRKKYDVIIFDTSPSLGYLTQNALVVADIVLSPCPQEALDYASLVQFWGVFSELATGLPGFADKKLYDCVAVFVTKAQSENNELAALITSWIRSSFGEYLCDVVIPLSIIPQRASIELKTAYEFTGKDLSTAAFKRYREPIDQLVRFVNKELNIAWSRS